MSAIFHFFKKNNVFLGYLERNTLKRNLTHGCFVSPLFHEHLSSLELPHEAGLLNGTLMQMWKSANIIVSMWKYYVEDFTLKHVLLFEICAREIFEKFVYKHSETIEYVKN